MEFVWIGIIVVILLIIAIGFVVGGGSKKHKGRHPQSKKLHSRLKTIYSRTNQKSTDSLKQSIVQLDIVMDDVLKYISKGESFGDRLINAKDKFKPDVYQRVWEAHKIRNKAVHELDYYPPLKLLATTFNEYVKIIKSKI